MVDGFHALRNELRELRRQHTKGRIDDDELYRRMQEAAVADPETTGGWWTLEPHTGKWIYSNGGPWYEVDEADAPAAPLDSVTTDAPKALAIGRAVGLLALVTLLAAAVWWFAIVYFSVVPYPFSGPATSFEPQQPTVQGTDGAHRYVITAGPAVQAATALVPAYGGKVEVGVDSLIPGFSIQVPAGAFHEPVQFSVSCSRISDVQGPVDVTPASPLILVDNGGRRSRQPIRVRIPVDPSMVADTLPFIYHPDTGRLEGLPLLAVHSDSIETRTWHFSHLVGLQIVLPMTHVFVSTDFFVGADTWPFANWGTFWEPGGICEGMSLTALWYRLHRRSPSGQKLWSALDPVTPFQTPDFGLDDVRAQHFATHIQSTGNDAVGVALTGLDGERGKHLTGDAKKKKEAEYYAWAWKTVVGDLLLTGEPQYVVIEDTGGEYHGMVAHSASIADKRLFVYDPNVPTSAELFIQFTDNGPIKPYLSAANAREAKDEGAVPFVHFYQLFTNNVVDPEAFNASWQRFTTERLQAPDYHLVEIDDSGRQIGPIGSHHTTAEKTLRVRLEEGGHTAAMDLMVYRAQVRAGASNARDVVPLNLDRDQVELSGIPLGDGDNELGFVILAENRQDIKAGLAWRDFRWVTVSTAAPATTEDGDAPTAGTIELILETDKVVVGTEVSFSVRVTNPPRQTRYTWHFPGQQPSDNGTSMTHIFSRAGRRAVRVEGFDADTGRRWAHDTLQVTVKPKPEPVSQEQDGLLGAFHFGEGRYRETYTWVGKGSPPSPVARPRTFWAGDDWALSGSSWHGAQPLTLVFTAQADGAVTFRTSSVQPESLYIGGSLTDWFPIVKSRLCHQVHNRQADVSYNRICTALRKHGVACQYHATGVKEEEVQIQVWDRRSPWIAVSEGDTIVLEVTPITHLGNGRDTDNDAIYVREWASPPQSGEIHYRVTYLVDE